MLYYDHQHQGIHVAIWHVTESYEELLGLLPDADSVCNEAETKFRSKSRITEWTAVRVLLYTMLERQVKIEYTDSGAPYFPSYEGLNISISHTKEYVAVALSEKHKVGIDIEIIEKQKSEGNSRVERVSSKFMNENEHVNSMIGILLTWSAKESVYKLQNDNHLDFKNDLIVESFDESNKEGSFNVIDRINKSYNITYKVFDDFVFTLTSKES